MRDFEVNRWTKVGALYVCWDAGEGYVVIDEESADRFVDVMNIKDILTDQIEALVRFGNDALETVGDEYRIEWGYYHADEDKEEAA